MAHLNVIENSTERRIRETIGRYSEALVLRTNELLYDQSNSWYARTIESEMLDTERSRWLRIAAPHLGDETAPIRIIDVGCGAGFVPMTIAPLLREEDHIVCADISSGMLEIARRTIEAGGHRCRFSYVKTEGTIPFSLPFASGSAGMITMNSVLHHFKDTGRFLQEIDRVLEPGGLLFIAHEPNSSFRLQKFLRWNFSLLDPLCNPKHALMMAMRRLDLEPLVRKLHYRLFPERAERAAGWLSQINSQLLAERLIDSSLGWAEIAAIADIRDEEGFAPETILPEYERIHLETYNHLHLVSIKHSHNPLLRKYESALKRRYPNDGATFFLVLRKIGSTAG